MSLKQILVIEDDPAIRRGVVDALAFAGYSTLEAGDGAARSDLSEREHQLLLYLASHPERAVSREEILARVWGLDPAGITTRTIDMHVARLREKLRDDPARPTIVLTVRGRGYMLRAG